jgi:hypothetical protein
MKMDADEIDTIIVKLIQDNFLNESLACSFARGSIALNFGENQNCKRTQIP